MEKPIATSATPSLERVANQPDDKTKPSSGGSLEVVPEVVKKLFGKTNPRLDHFRGIERNEEIGKPKRWSALDPCASGQFDIWSKPSWGLTARLAEGNSGD